jgi:hypothetical protein
MGMPESSSLAFEFASLGNLERLKLLVNLPENSLETPLHDIAGNLLSNSTLQPLKLSPTFPLNFSLTDVCE